MNENEDGGIFDEQFGGPDDEEGGFEDEEGGADEYEQGGFFGDEEGGPDDDPEWLAEHGGKRKRKRRSLFSRKRRKGGRKRRAACPPSTGNLDSPLGIASRSASMRAGIPYISVSRGVKINFSPVPLQYRIPREFARLAVELAGINTGQSPVLNTIAPPAGPFTLDLLPPVGQIVQAPIVLLDIGPQTLTTQAGATLTTRITGRYGDGEAADLGEFSFQLPSTNKVMRCVFLPYKLYNGVPVQKMMASWNQYLTPFITNPVSLTQDPDSAGDIESPIVGPIPGSTSAIRISGQVPSGLQLTGTIVTPAHPMWSDVLESLRCTC